MREKISKKHIHDFERAAARLQAVMQNIQKSQPKAVLYASENKLSLTVDGELRITTISEVEVTPLKPTT